MADINYKENGIIYFSTDEGAYRWSIRVPIRWQQIVKQTGIEGLALSNERTLYTLKPNKYVIRLLGDPSVEPTNNRAEQQLKPMVIMRKLTSGNRADSGASDQAVAKSIVRTGVFSGVEPLDTFRALSVKPLTSFLQLPKPRPP